MMRSSEQPEPISILVLSGTDWDLVTTPAASAIAFGDGDPILLQNMN